MTCDDKKPGDRPSLMATVAAIVESMLERQGITLSTERPSAWKAAHREEMAEDQHWRDIGWNRA